MWRVFRSPLSISYRHIDMFLTFVYHIFVVIISYFGFLQSITHNEGTYANFYKIVLMHYIWSNQTYKPK
jgi:hypothetical protein